MAVGTQATGGREQRPGVCWGQPEAKSWKPTVPRAVWSWTRDSASLGDSACPCKHSGIVTTWRKAVGVRSAVWRAFSRAYGRPTVDTRSGGMMTGDPGPGPGQAYGHYELHSAKVLLARMVFNIDRKLKISDLSQLQLASKI